MNSTETILLRALFDIAIAAADALEVFPGPKLANVNDFSVIPISPTEA